ncbi:MAG: diguanylate cyclase [Tissierellales bacterium]|jgi:diguanylate cyclase (GGDEF)-like protein|nr:diguanylate cyclase [Tissierellales bacterium]
MVNKNKLMESWRKISGKFIVLIIIVWIFILYMLYSSYENEKKTYLKAELDSFDSKIEATLKTYELFSNYIFDQSINNQEVLDVFTKASKVEGKDRDILRQKLYDMLVDNYNDMTDYNFRQLHFHFSNGDSFLRFHRPEKYGDNLIDIRESIRISNQENRYVFGFEEGRIYNGYRFVYPLNYEGEHIGSVEVSVSMATLIKVLTDLYPGMDIHFILDEKVVSNKVFDEEKTNYMRSIFSDDYFVDKEIQEKSFKQNRKLTFEQTREFFEMLKTQVAEKIITKEDFTLDADYNGHTYLTQFLSVDNVKNEKVGYLVAIVSNDQVRAIESDAIKEGLLITLVVFLFIISYRILVKSHNKLKQSSSHDFLTKAYNRHKFLEMTLNEVERYKRYNEKFSIVMIDIDHFKNVNDTYGHSAGDRVLVELSKLVQDAIRSTDVFARWGGEEFICLLPNTKKKDAIVFAEKIRLSIEKYDFKEVGSITASFGVADINIDVSIARLIESADEALYRAKNNGRNRVEG